MFTASARTPVRSLGTGDDGERRASSPFLSSSRSLLRPADSRRQESATGSTGNVNVQILEAIKSLQEQVADLQAKSTQPAVSSIQQCAVSKKAPKELLTSIHSVVRHLRERLDAPMQWDTSSGFSSPENMRVTSEITTACVNEKYPASVVQKEHEQEAKLLDRRLARSRTVPGTQKHHCFIPISPNTLEVKLFSSSTVSRREKVEVGSAPVLTPQATAISGYVTMAYDGECWLGCVVGANTTEHAITVKFLHPCIPASSFVYPEREYQLNVDYSDVCDLCQCNHCNW
ncbi:hypothetical protein EMCRGX_G005052 [Ephydatia muelleri]